MEPTEKKIGAMYRLTANIQETTAEEAEEILNHCRSAKNELKPSL